MADFAEILQDYSSLVVDYSALLELNDSGLEEALIQSVIDLNKTVFVSGSFKAFHESAIKAGNDSEREMISQIKLSMKALVDAHLLRANKQASIVNFFLEHMGNEDECFFIGRNSNAFSRLRNINAQGRSAIFVIDHGKLRFYPSIADCMESERPYSVNPIAGNSNFIALDYYFSVGDSLVTDDQETVTLTSLISTGAEGLVFCTNDEEFVAKVYHRGGITPLRWYKLMKMRELGLDAKNICWPVKLLYSKDKTPVGYLMRKASGHTISRAFDGPDAMEKYFSNWSRLDVVESTLGFLRIMDYLHLHGVLAGDIQLKNAMIDDSGIYLIDIDSVQYQDLPCPVGTEEFTRPELWDKSFVSFLRRPQDEDYSISILVFSMLFCGQHPYAQRNGLETLRDEMEALSFPYTVDDSENERIPIGGYDKIWDALTPELKDMFVRAFSQGEIFECAEWTYALEDYRDQLKKHVFEDEEYYRVFPYRVADEKKPTKRPVPRSTYNNPVINTGVSAQSGASRSNSSASTMRSASSKSEDTSLNAHLYPSHSASSTTTSSSRGVSGSSNYSNAKSSGGGISALLEQYKWLLIFFAIFLVVIIVFTLKLA